MNSEFGQIFAGKTVIITGASAGVGAACARKYAQLGANLILVARGAEGLERIAAELEQRTSVHTVAMDVADTRACVELMQTAAKHFGGIDVLINNAGMHVRGAFQERDAMDMAAMVDINLRAPVILTAAAIPFLKQSDSAAIVMVGSLAGMAPLQGAAVYSATKSGLRAFTYALADELHDDGINVGLVSPGPIDTGFIMDEIDQVEDIVFSQPMSSADEVADAVLSIAAGRKLEIPLPAISGLLVTLGYLFPLFRRKTRSMLYKKGRRNKEKYRQRGKANSS